MDTSSSESYRPYLVFTPKLLKVFLKKSQDLRIDTSLTILDLSKNFDAFSTKEKIVDARFDSYREKVVWVLIEQTQKNFLYFRSINFGPTELECVEDFLIRPSLV